MMITRRDFAGTTWLALAGLAMIGTIGKAAASSPAERLAAAFGAIEAAADGRLGVAVLDPASGLVAGHRAEERFPMCSTFKLLAAAAVLSRVDAGKEALERRVRFAASDLVRYSPATEKHVGEGMSIAELCAAAVTLSDNTAANLLLDALGGPAALTQFARSLGDGVTRLDRIEPHLNEATPGDPRDTTSPAAMAADIRALVFGEALSAASRHRLTAWLRATRTGDKRLRARLPDGWQVGNKTGSGQHGTANDVGILWPPAGSPLVVAAYLTETTAAPERRDEALAAVGHAVADSRRG
jgi:beta-lactamase class A